MDRHSSWQASSSLKSLSKSHLLFVGKKALNNTSYGAAVSEVEIDVLTGDRRMLRSDIHFDCGQSLNPAVDMGQVHLLLFWLIFQAAILPHQAMYRTRRWKHYEMLGCMNDWHLDDFSPSLRVFFRIQLPWPSPPYRSSFCCCRLKVLLFKGWASWPASRSLWMTPRERLSPTVHGITRYPQLQTSQQRCTLTFSRWSRPDLFLPALDEKDQSNLTSLIRREVKCSEEKRRSYFCKYYCNKQAYVLSYSSSRGWTAENFSRWRGALHSCAEKHLLPEKMPGILVQDNSHWFRIWGLTSTLL